MIPKTGGQKFSRGEREKLEKDVFGQKYGSQISKNDYRGAVKELRNAENKAQDPKQKGELDKKINYLRRIGGI